MESIVRNDVADLIVTDVNVKWRKKMKKRYKFGIGAAIAGISYWLYKRKKKKYDGIIADFFNGGKKNGKGRKK